MYKKNLLFLLTILVMTLTCIGFTSCGSDDDDNVNNSVSIVGTWEHEWNDNNESGYTILIFNSNGTGILRDYYYEGKKEIHEDEEYFDWIFDEDTMKLKLLFGDEVEIWRVEMLTSRKLVIDGDVFTRK